LEVKFANSYFNELLDIKNNYAPFFEKLKAEIEEDDLAELFNYFLNNVRDSFITKVVIVEINKLNNKKNLQSLLDFILTKKDSDYDEGLNVCDLTSLKILCVKTISNYKDRSAVVPILYCLNNKSENYKFRLAAAEALGKIGDNSAVDSLIKIVKDEDEKSVYVRESAAHALGILGDMRAVEPFLDILEGKKSFLDKFTFLKEKVLEALGHLNVDGNKRAKDAFLNALQDSCAQVRLNALESISNANVVDLFDDVKELLNDEDDDVAKAAVVVLYNLSDRRILDEILDNRKLKQCCRDQAQEIIEEYEEDE